MTKILLFSGGLDSFCLNQVVYPHKRIYINVGTKDGIKEIENIKKMPFKTEIINFNLVNYEMKNKIIPYRNTFFVLLAAQYGEEIFLGATAGDTTKDKDYVFKAQMEGHLNYFSLDKHKVNVIGYPYIVYMPFRELTKTEIINKYFRSGGSTEELLKHSRSCYEGKDKECGICRSCIRKAIAFINNSLPLDGFENDPFKNIPKEFHEKQLTRGKEGQNYKWALKNYERLKNV